MNDLLAAEIRALRERLERLERYEQPAGFSVSTSFPSSPSAGLRVWRSDLGLLCYYDGARWVTAHEAITAPADSYTTSVGAAPFTSAFLAQYQPLITRVALSAFVATTNSGANFWSITLRSGTGTFSALSDVHTWTTAAQAANAWGRQEGAPTVAVPSNYGNWAINVTPTGAPGAITLGIAVYYRLIIP